jgi:hypothetical protein
MEFIQHSLNWCKGEIFEGKLSLFFGLIILLVGLSYFKWGSTVYAKAIIWPLIIVALMAMGVGIYLIDTNSKRIVEYKAQFADNPTEFVQSEKNRTEDFIGWYPKTQKILFVLMVAGMLCMLLSHSAITRAIGIGLMLLSLYGFVLDHFSEERAGSYHKEIIEHLAE